MQFLSKRWLGNFNFLLTRKKRFDYNRLIELIDLFKEQGVTHVLITGDLSVTSRKIEFKMGKRFLELLKKEGFEVFTIPGNHDHYTKSSYRKSSFYRFFDSRFSSESPFNLKEHRVTTKKLQDGLWLVAIDTALATSLISSNGLFSHHVEAHLKQALETIPKEDQILLMNHFPFFASDPPSKQLKRGEELKNLLLKTPNLLLYLHGHTHRQTVADLRPSDLPIVSDSGSTPHTHSGACHLIDITPKEVAIEVFRYKNNAWGKQEEHHFNV